MWEEIYYQSVDTISKFFDKTILFVSFIIGCFLSAIGFPKEIIVFIFVLTIIDLITKHLSIVVVNYKTLSLRTYFQAWKDKVLTSRALKNGLVIKTAFYGFLMYISHQLIIIDIIYLGSEIAGAFYTAIALIEISSALENFRDMGYGGVNPLITYIKNKLNGVLGNKEGDVK